MPRILFVENDDSFTWNLVDALPFAAADLTICDAEGARARLAEPCRFDAMVIGPGPRDPQRVGLVDLVLRAAEDGLPLLGVCLGHQAIGLAFGAELVRGEPAHGRSDTAVFTPSRRFPGFAGPLAVMRYHSLRLSAVQQPLRVVASTPDGVVMAIEHAQLPIAGLQFHPDSYACPRGRELLASFFEAVGARPRALPLNLGAPLTAVGANPDSSGPPRQPAEANGPCAAAPSLSAARKPLRASGVARSLPPAEH